MKLEEQNVLLFTRTMGLGGTENVVLQLCEILKPRVNNIIVCSCGGVNIEKLEKLNIKHYLIPDISRKDPLSIIKTLIVVKKIITNERITLIHSHHRMAAVYSKLISNNRVIRVSTAHNIFLDKIKITHWGYKDSNLIAVGEDVEKNLLEVYKVPQKNISVIYNTVSPFNSEIIELPIFFRTRNRILIGNIARLSEQKGLEYFIEAAGIVHESYPDAYFYIIGNGEDEEKLISLVNKLKFNSFINFLGFRSDIQNIISQLDFVVLSSLWEGFPLTPIETFSVGKTIVATDIKGTKEIVKNNFNGLLVRSKDSTSLAEAILKLIKDEVLRKNLEKNAEKTYLEKFSFNSYKDQIINYYKKIE